MLGVLAEAAFRTLLLAATVQLGLWLFHIRRAHLLLVTWTVVLAASLAMPALQWATPLRLPIVPGDAAAWLIGAADHPPQAGAAVSGPISAEGVQNLPAMEAWLVAAYLLVSGILVLRLIVGVALSLRLRSKATAIRLPSAPGARIRISPAVAAPVTVGRVILLPPDVVDWPPAMRQAAIAHECAHVARRDFALLVLSQLNRALFWFSPVSWLLHRRLAALAELASDDHAIQVTGDRTGYAEVLLEMGRRSGPLLRGLAMARPATLRHRIERVLSDRVRTSPVGLAQQSVIVAGAAIAAIAAASPGFDPATPYGRVASRPRPPALALPDDPAPRPALAASALPPMPIEDPRPAPPPAAPLAQAARAATPQALAVPVGARPVLRPVVSNTHPGPARPVPLHTRATDARGEAATRPATEAVGLTHPSTAIIADANRPSATHPPLGEPSLLRAIDQQTCDGAYLPGSVYGNGYNWINMVRATFFHEADGSSLVKFYVGVRDPVTLPVTVTGRAVEFTAVNNTSFKMLPQGTNHLAGTTQRPYGTIDLACGEGGGRLADRKS